MELASTIVHTFVVKKIKIKFVCVLISNILKSDNDKAGNYLKWNDPGWFSMR